MVSSWPATPVFTGMRAQRSFSMVTNALWICAYFETRCVPRWMAKRSGYRMCGEVLARSVWLCMRSSLGNQGAQCLTVCDVLDFGQALVCQSNRRNHVAAGRTGVGGNNDRVVCLGVATEQSVKTRRCMYTAGDVVHAQQSSATHTSQTVCGSIGSRTSRRSPPPTARRHCTQQRGGNFPRARRGRRALCPCRSARARGRIL